MSATKEFHFLIVFICNVEASATDEPGAEKLNAGICAEGRP